MTAMTGANLEQLNDLSADYVTTSTAMLTKAEQLNTRITAAIAAFNSTMTSLSNETQTLTGQIETEMSSLSSTAGSVEWTGNNRNAFDADLGQFSTAVSKGTTMIRDSTTKLSSKVSTEFGPSLSEFSKGLGERMAKNNEAANETSKSVATQRELLDAAANSGWSS